MFSTIPISKLIHFHAYISSIFIAHDTVTAIEMIFDGDSISNIQNCIRTSFNDHSNSFMTWHKSYTMTIIQNFLKSQGTNSTGRLRGTKDADGMKLPKSRILPELRHSTSKYLYPNHRLKPLILLFGLHHRSDQQSHDRVFIKDHKTKLPNRNCYFLKPWT